MNKKTALIIGAGPAGLTAATELLKKSDILPIVIEQADHVGGISATFHHHGNRIDVGGHRFFSKSQAVVDWWLSFLPLQHLPHGQAMTYHGKTHPLLLQGSSASPDPDRTDAVMLVRKRKSRILFSKTLFDYPLRPSLSLFARLGFLRSFRIAKSALKSMFYPIRPEKNLEDFFINRFGTELYEIFFKSYTEKVWGTPCTAMSAEWGRQRIKKLSFFSVLQDGIFKKIWHTSSSLNNTHTSLIEQFLYPKYGPGQLWECVAKHIQDRGGMIYLNESVHGIETSPDHRIRTVITRSVINGVFKTYKADYVLSSMPIPHLINALSCTVPQAIQHISDGLGYRDFLTVGILLKHLRWRDITDTWIYIQEQNIRAGRIQFFNNWSPYMVANPDTWWIGVEYFCAAQDDFWHMSDAESIAFAAKEMESIGLCAAQDVLDGVVIRMPKAYPAYTGTYTSFPTLRSWLDTFPNLFLVGRNGMHKYNNQDHSMLTAMAAIEAICSGSSDTSRIWDINTEEDYHEET